MVGDLQLHESSASNRTVQRWRPARVEPIDCDRPQFTTNRAVQQR